VTQATKDANPPCHPEPVEGSLDLPSSEGHDALSTTGKIRDPSTPLRFAQDDNGIQNWQRQVLLLVTILTSPGVPDSLR
jgi:hypothetical protein